MMVNLGTPTPEPLVNSFVYKESDDDIEVTHAYTLPLPFLTTMEPAYTILIGDEVISTTPIRETDKFIKSSIDDLVPIPRESESTSLVPPLETPPLSTPKPKENLKPNPHQLLIPYPSWLQEEKFQALVNHTGRADHFTYRIDIVESLCDKFLILNDQSGGSTTYHFDHSLPDYEIFRFDMEEKSSGSTTTHSDFSLPEYDSFIFDLSIDPFPPADRSAFYHEEFVDELAHIISPPKYDYFYFDLEANPGEFTRVLKENIFDLSTKGLTINELNDSSPLLSDYESSLSKEFSKIDLLVSFPSGNEDIIFDPRIIIIKRVQSKRFQFFPLDDFLTFSFVSDSLL
ncbi:hypothetical protein Tco_0351563 [Tanacetum coccineum]